MKGHGEIIIKEITNHDGKIYEDGHGQYDNRKMS